VEICLLDGLAEGGQSLIEGLLPAFRDTKFAYALASLMVLTAAFLALIATVRHIVATRALQARRRQIAGFIAFERVDETGTGADPHEVQFARRFREIDTAMQRSGVASGALAQAWKRYRKTFAFAGTPPVRAAQRPTAFLYGAMPPPAWLGLAANTFVGVGLLLTFLGLVAALSFAAEGMRNATADGMMDSMRDLLAASASKFVTSIAGVGLSLILNLLERILAADLRRNIDSLSSAMELGIRVDNDAHSAALAERLGRIPDRLDQPNSTAEIST